MRKIRPIKKKAVSAIRQFRRNIHGVQNYLDYAKATLVNVEFNIFGDHNLIIIHNNAFLNNVSFNLYGNHHRIIIGEGCRFNERGSIWAEDHHCLISIGKGSTFEGVHLSATEADSRLIIGEDCMFSYDIDVRTGDSHSILSSTTGRRTNYAKSIVFGDHVWVASHCIFTKGAEIGSHSIVGTGSLVNRAHKEEHVLLAGRPAQIRKRDVRWLRERVYESSQTASVEDIQSRLG